MKTYCKVIGRHSIRQYQGYHPEEYLLKNRYIVLYDGIPLTDGHMSLTKAVKRFKSLVEYANKFGYLKIKKA